MRKPGILCIDNPKLFNQIKKILKKKIESYLF